MADVTAESMTLDHVKAARIFLDLTASDLSDICSVGVATVRNFESGSVVRLSSRQAIFDALTAAGIVFYNGGSPGVRLVKPKEGL